MDDKAKAARRAYKREWARKNPDKCRKYQENYWTKIAEQAEQAVEAVEASTTTTGQTVARQVNADQTELQ